MEERYVDQIMSHPVETVRPTTSLGEAAEVMIEHDVGAIVIVDDSNELSGLLTATDYVQLVRDGKASPGRPVSEIMQTDVVTTTRETPASDVLETMLDHLIHHVPVVDGETVVGMVSSFDLAASLNRTLEP